MHTLRATLLVALFPYMFAIYVVNEPKPIEVAHAAPCELEVVVCEGEEVEPIEPVSEPEPKPESKPEPEYTPVQIPPRTRPVLERIAWVKNIAYPHHTINAPISDSELDRNADIIRQTAREYGIDPDTAVQIAWCESRLSHVVVNKLPTSTASGLFQFVYKTFLHVNERGNFGYVWEDRLDPEVNAEMAMWLMANEGLHHWNASANCWR